MKIIYKDDVYIFIKYSDNNFFYKIHKVLTNSKYTIIKIFNDKYYKW